jgi:Domain of unknown function (DUF1918)
MIRREESTIRREEMRAEVGDKIVVRGRHTGDGDREGIVTEVHGADGTPPYLVRWIDGHETVFMPASGTLVEHRPAPQAG